MSGELIHRSPGITAIYNELKSSSRNNILDLGSSSGLSFNFFSQLSCNIHFESIDDFLKDLHSTPDKNFLTQLDDYLSSFSQEKKFDVILAWDIFNYFDSESLKWLINRLSQHCRADTLLHMVKYIGRNIPATPRHYQIMDQYQIRICGQELWCSRPFSNLDTATMLKAMPGYSMEHTYLQHQGMTQDISEQVFRYQPDGKNNKRREASAELPIHTGISATMEAHRSYGLETICEYLKTQQNACVLDLGSKVTRSGDFLHQYAEQVFVEDLAPSLISSPNSDEPAIRQHALRYNPDVKFDVIFAWDLFSYCSRAQLELIYQKLAPHVKPNTKMLAFFYTGSELPVRPQKCYIIDDKNIALVPAPRRDPNEKELSAVALLKVFNQFNLANTFILRPGMHRGIYEYVFQTKPGKSDSN
jgi:hypothetical protein